MSFRISGRAVFLCTFVFLSVLISYGQRSELTGRADNARTGANVNETLLAPGNVNKNNFGRLFSQPVDYVVMGQPLYVPNVQIPGKGTHNVVYMVTMLDTVYAFDADDNQGDNAAPLWQVSFLDPANGVTIATGANLPCTASGGEGLGFNQEGIVSTPAIDGSSSTMYVVAKTVENGVVRHRLHALDLATGVEKFGGPALITAQSVSKQGKVWTFNSLHQMNRPGLLLVNGTVYIGFGSNSCNDGNSGWVLSYDASTLQQTGVFNTNPDHGLTSIWQSGQGLTADADGNVYAETAEGNFDIDAGGQGYTNSVLKLGGSPFDLIDYFTPSNVAFLNQHDLDMSSTGPVVLPDQDGPVPHEVIAAGKQGTIYLMNRDNMGQYNPNMDQIVQEIPLAVGAMFSSPAYWNGIVYFCGNAQPLHAYSLSGGLLSSVPVGMTTQKITGSHSPTISANGDTNGIVWVVNSGQLWAFDAITLKLLYNTGQSGARDKLSKLGHFATQVVANGKVYIATRNSLEVYGLFHLLTVSGGNNQSATALTPLPAPIQVQATHAYTGAPLANETITFSDGNKGGVFNPPSAVTDENGFASTSYTVPKKAGTYTVTASGAAFGSVTLTESSTAAAPVKMIVYSGGQQTAPAGTVLPLPLTVQVQDMYKNGVTGLSVTFDNGGKGQFVSQSTVTTDSAGKAKVNYQLPNTPGKYQIKAGASGLKTITFTEFAVVGNAGSVAIVSGDHQSVSAGSAFPQALVVKVTDTAGNPVPGTSVNFTAPSGSFTGNPATTDTNGNASVNYAAGTVAGSVTVTATAGSGSAQFTETVLAGPASVISISGGNNQLGAAGTMLGQFLTVQVADQYGNPTTNVAVLFSDNGAGGQFSNPNPALTDQTGMAAQGYILPSVPGTYMISASADGVANPALFTETAQ